MRAIKRLVTNKRLLNYQQRVNRLRCFTLIFFLLLFVPVSVISLMSFEQLKKDQLSQYQRQSDKVSIGINKRLFKIRTLTNAITHSEFNYYQHLYNPVNEQLTQALSPLANPEYYKRTDGLIGYFQVDQAGQFNSPVWPFIIDSAKDKSALGTSMEPEFVARRQLAVKLQKIVFRSNELQGFIANKLADKHKMFQMLSDVPGYFIYYRVVANNVHTKLQGYVLNREAYLNTIIAKYARFDSPISLALQLTEPNNNQNYLFSRPDQQDQVTITQPKQLAQLNTQLLIRSQPLNWPFENYTLSYFTPSLQLSSTAIYSVSLMAILMAAILLGCYGFYRIGVQQLKLAEQRLNFVSSVSHELKTPLTSIRMYSEMLKTGTVLTDEHQLEYYEFIHSESERLSRLIDNILQLATLSQPEHNVNLQYTKLSILTDIIRSKICSLFDSSDFKLTISHPFEEPDKVTILVDSDAFSQVVINITDNAIKFFDREKINDKSRQKIDFTFKFDSKISDQLQLEIRDYGEGISAEQENKIFDLFYRGGSELTRSTQGTGIGLALVRELMLAQQGSIQVQRMSPGLAMKMSFKCRLSQR
ncbi:MAG: ATP-binding protein [Colwellia sp.]|nr:ATP-binding protein [Colwellia sp.]